jgi:hypothetical protein
VGTLEGTGEQLVDHRRGTARLGDEPRRETGLRQRPDHLRATGQHQGAAERLQQLAPGAPCRGGVDPAPHADPGRREEVVRRIGDDSLCGRPEHPVVVGHGPRVHHGPVQHLGAEGVEVGGQLVRTAVPRERDRVAEEHRDGLTPGSVDAR